MFRYGPGLSRRFEVLGQFQTLTLIIGATCLAIEAVRLTTQLLVLKPSYDLSVFNQEWDFMGPDFQHSSATATTCFLQPEARIKKPCVMHSEFAH